MGTILNIGYTLIKYLGAITIIFILVWLIGVIFNYIERLEIKLLSKIFGNRKATCIVNKATFIGTITHELSHAAVAIILGCKVTGMKLLSLFSKNGELGHVSVVTKQNIVGKIKMSLISCAPVFANTTLAIIVYSKVLKATNSVPLISIAWYMIVSLINHASMSSVDTKHYIKGAPFIIVILSMIFAIAKVMLNISII